MMKMLRNVSEPPATKTAVRCLVFFTPTTLTLRSHSYTLRQAVSRLKVDVSDSRAAYHPGTHGHGHSERHDDSAERCVL
jgi:hypothetical protein